MTPKKRRLWVVLLMMCGLALATTLAVFALRDNLSFFYTPSDIYNNRPLPKSSFRLGGMVKKGSIMRSKDGLMWFFDITDFQHDVTVSYHGLVPDLFREGQGVVAEGSLNSDGLFVATKLLAKHDEKYMPPEVKKALERE